MDVGAPNRTHWAKIGIDARARHDPFFVLLLEGSNCLPAPFGPTEARSAQCRQLLHPDWWQELALMTRQCTRPSW